MQNAKILMKQHAKIIQNKGYLNMPTNYTLWKIISYLCPLSSLKRHSSMPCRSKLKTSFQVEL